MRKIINLMAFAAVLFVPWHAKAQCTDGTPCQFTVAGEDSYGDGWEGSLTIYRNNVQMSTFTVSEETNTETFTVCQGDVIRIDWTGSDQYRENTFTITGGDGTMYVNNAHGYTYAPSGTVVEFMACPTCLPVRNLTTLNVDSSSITISWTDPANSGATYSVAYWSNGDTMWTTTADTFLIVTDLNASTPYHFRVRAICSSTDSSLAANAIFRTACGAITLPYTVDFEDAAFNGAWYPCWDSVIHAGTDPSVNDQNGPANHTPGGTYSMYLQSNSSENYNLVVSPRVPLAGDQIFVSFWARVTSSNNAWLKAGVMTNPRDTSTFIPLVQCSGNSWTEYSFSTSSLDPNATYYIAWLGYGISSYGGNAFIGKFDDIVIREDNGCNKPNMAVVDSVAPYEAYLTWTSGGASASSYDLFYGTQNNIDSATVINNIAASDDTIHYTLSSLLPQTTYYAWVRTACGSETADAKNFDSFTTQLTCAPVINAVMGNVSYTAAQLSWAYDTTQGFPSSGVQITLVDNDDTSIAPEVVDVTGNSYTFNNLLASHNYTATLRNLCQAANPDPDTATAATVSFTTASCNEIAGGTNSNDNMPLNAYYNYSFSQTIYPSNVMPGVDTINGIAYKAVSGNSATRTVDIYMGHTTESSLGDNSLPVNGMTHVLTSGSYTINTDGWSQILFDTAFVYNGTDNLIVTVVDNTGSYIFSRPYFQTHSTQNLTISAYNDNNTYNPATAVSANVASNSPDIRFVANCEVPECFAPMMTLGDIDSNNITVNWEAVGTESEWAVGIKTAESTAIAWESSTTTSNTYTFSNLGANTAYDIYVGSLCNGDTLISTVRAKTLCGSMTLPYTTGFEGDNLNDNPSCWTIINGYTYSQYDYATGSYINYLYPIVDANANTGNQALTLRGQNSNTLIASSAIPSSANSISVSFWAENSISYGTGALQAGLLTDLTDANTFVPMVDINSDGDYALYEFQASLAYDSTYYLAFRYNASTNYSYASVDDINIRTDDGCHRPTNITAVGTAVNEIEMNWDNDGASNNFAVQYRQRGTTEWSVLDFTGSTTYIFSNLDTATAYELRVGSICTTDTLWNTSAIYAKTLCAPMTMPYFEGFENDMANEEPTCWNISGQTYYYSYYNTTYPAVTTSDPQSGSNALEFSSLTGPTIVSSMAVPLPGDSIYVSFWAKLQGNPNLEAGVMTNPAYDTTFIPLLTINSGVDYARYEFNTSTLNNLETYYVAFRYTASSSYISASVDDITIRRDEGCMYPSSLAAAPTSNSAALSWHNAGAAGTFAIEYRTAGGTWSTAQTTNDTTFTLNNLNASTMYEVRVGFLCGTDTLWSLMSFATDCGLIALPYSENFNSTANGSMPPCWTYDSQVDVYDEGIMWHTYTGNGSSVAVVPELDGNISKLQITFKAKLGLLSEGDAILIGIADHAGTLLTWLDTLTNPEQSREGFVTFTVYFPNYNIPANGVRVALGHTLNTNNWALIDDINIIELPDCYPVANLTGHNLDDIENTTFTWHSQGYATEWQVYVDTVTVGIDSLETLPDSLFTTVYDTSYTLPIGAIQGGGIYNFYVRSQCSGNTHSNWVTREFGAGSIIMNDGTVSDTVEGCGFVVYDNGGPIAGYHPNSNSSLVLRTENAGSQLQIFGGKFGFGSDPATLTVYDGEGTTGDVLYTYSTVNGRDTLLNTILATSSNGSLTITFTSNGSMCHTGYELYVRCTDGALCPRPTQLQAEMTSATTATATWQGTASNYNFYYRLNGSATWVRQAVNTNSINLTGLTADTVYDMYVVALCSATDSSSASVIRQLRTYGSTPERQVFTVVVNSADASMGTATADHTGEVEENTLVTATATANSGYRFTNWTSNGSVVSTDNPYSFTLTANITLTANFESTGSEPQGIDDINSANIALYPNPAHTSVTLTGISGQATVTVVDMNGREVHTQAINNQAITLDLTGYAQGAYFVRITGEQVNVIRKLIVK